jgi:hypothetical protein
MEKEIRDELLLGVAPVQWGEITQQDVVVFPPKTQCNLYPFTPSTNLR